MTFKKLVLTTAVATAMGAATIPSHAVMYGVAGEAILVPLALNDPQNTGTGEMNTYVQLKLPNAIGSDYVINNYTATNVRAGVPANVQKVINPDPNYGWTVHWTWFDPESKNPLSGTCFGSPNDSILWTTDENLLDIQRDVDIDGVPVGVPRMYCGSSALPEAGYVVFQTARAADSLAADFVMEGTAWITDNRIAYSNNDTTDGSDVALLSIPAFPMPDGEDPNGSGANSLAVIASNEVIQQVTSNGGGKGDLVSQDPVVVSPLSSGVRLNNGDGVDSLRTVIAGGVQGYYSNQGYSAHVMWFDKNNDDRVPFVNIYDEHEFNENYTVKVPYELNILVYNQYCDYDEDDLPTSSRWDKVSDYCDEENLRYTSLIDLLYADTYKSMSYPMPFYWDFTVMGYAEYWLDEEGDADNTTGFPSRSMAAFEAQEDSYNEDAWARHLMTLRGFR